MICGRPANEIHHIIPLSQGGRDISENKILLCQDCHRKGHLHSNFQETTLGLLTAKFYVEDGPARVDRPSEAVGACTLSEEALDELSVVQKRNSKSQKRSKVLLFQVPLEDALKIQEQRSLRRSLGTHRKIPPSRPSVTRQEKKKLEPRECHCGCGSFIPQRPNQFYRGNRCKDRFHNKEKREKNKQNLRLLSEIVLFLDDILSQKTQESIRRFENKLEEYLSFRGMKYIKSPETAIENKFRETPDLIWSQLEIFRNEFKECLRVLGPQGGK